MTTPVKATQAMIATMSPALRSDTWVFCTTRDRAFTHPDSLATFTEDEGTSLILPEATARQLGFPTDLPMACITLTVHSALDGIGLTAAVATVLTQAGIPCNMVAAFHHDHVFVPADRAQDALATLAALAASA
jgi:uncharacterized protein